MFHEVEYALFVSWPNEIKDLALLEPIGPQESCSYHGLLINMKLAVIVEGCPSTGGLLIDIDKIGVFPWNDEANVVVRAVTPFGVWNGKRQNSVFEESYFIRFTHFRFTFLCLEKRGRQYLEREDAKLPGRFKAQKGHRPQCGTIGSS